MPDSLQQLLTNYLDHHPSEQAVVERIRGLAREHRDCFHRTCMPGHITGSAWVLSPDRQHCLMLHHRKLGKWLQPGGHADGDTDVLRVAVREACEESGLKHVFPLIADRPLDVDVHLIPERRNADGTLKEPAHEHHDLRFLLATDESTPLAVSEESHDVRWCTAQQVYQLTQEESVLRLLHKTNSWLQSACQDRRCD